MQNSIRSIKLAENIFVFGGGGANQKWAFFLKAGDSKIGKKRTRREGKVKNYQKKCDGKMAML